MANRYIDINGFETIQIVCDSNGDICITQAFGSESMSVRIPIQQLGLFIRSIKKAVEASDVK